MSNDEGMTNPGILNRRARRLPTCRSRQFAETGQFPRYVVKLFPTSWDRFRSFHFFRVLAVARFAVAQGAVMECHLRVGHLRCIAFPSFKHGSLQSAPEGKTEFPRHVVQLIHRIEMFGGLQIALTT